MNQQMQRHVLIAALALAPCLAFAAPTPIDLYYSPVKNHHALFTAPPRHIPASDAVDAPLLGNGSLLAALGGAPERPTFFINQNSLWEMGDMNGVAKPLGVLSLDLPSLQGGSWNVDQDLGRAVTTAVFAKDGVSLQMESAVIATEDLLWVKLTATGGEVAGKMNLRLPGRKEDAERRDGVQVVERRFEKNVRKVSGAACAARVLDGGDEFKVVPGKPVVIVASTRSLLGAAGREDFTAAAVKRAATFRAAELPAVERAHAAWWKGFWSRSFVEIPDKVLEQRYYLSQYAMASASRDPEFPPGLFGWNTSDSPQWSGCYFLNYNFFAPFYGLCTANHIEQADPCARAIAHVAERTATDPRVRTEGIPGIYQSRTLGPYGSFRPSGRPHGDPDPKAKYKSPEQKSNGGYACVPLAQQWYATRDLDFAKRAYPYVEGVATFWEHWLKFEDGRYNDYDDPVHEESGHDKNPLVSLSFVRMVMNLALDMSTELKVDANRREKWQHIRDHIAPFPTCTVADLPANFRGRDPSLLSLPIFRYTEEGTPWWQDNTVGIQHIYPGGGIGLDSPPELLERGRNQIRFMNRWVDGNGMNSFYAAAARVGYDPVVILAKMHDMIVKYGGTNGMIRGNVHGMEHFSIVPNAIQEMLMQSHEGVLRFFPVWPKDQDARFGTLRADGAFLVSAELKGGVVGGVKIVSEKGRDLVMQNPWPGKSVTVSRKGKAAEAVSGDRFTLKTAAAEQLALRPE